ncbi:MAG TPA: DoxX family protein [Vicinamibacteria bacterium]|nr:DoxX family protein [Vicinamibacteria bacterium]
MRTKVGYLVVTGLFSAMMLVSAFAYLTGAPQMVAAFRHLGYPDYFRILLGTAKVLGVLALVAPRVPRVLREWAYAGFAITTVSAAVSHAVSGDPVAHIAAPVVALALLLASRLLWRPGLAVSRPTDRIAELPRTA